MRYRAGTAFTSPRRRAALLQVVATTMEKAPKAAEKLEAKLAPILADTPAALKLSDAQQDKETAQREKNRAIAEEQAVREFWAVLNSPAGKLVVAEWDVLHSGTALESSNLKPNALAQIVYDFNQLGVESVSGQERLTAVFNAAK